MEAPERNIYISLMILYFYLQMDVCAIGATKKCCYMCYLLGKYMFDDAHGKPLSTSKCFPNSIAE